MSKATAKGLVLAAGFGTRLRPLTEFYPKPLMPFAGSTPLELALWRLKAAGINEYAVNSHHLAPLIAAYTNSNPLGLKIKIAHEPELLGTGGVYNPLRSWLGAADLVVVNGDIVSTIDIRALLASHRQSGAVATMALLPTVIPGENAVYHVHGCMVAIGKQPPATYPEADAGNYACVQVLSPAFLDLLPKSGSFDVIAEGYQVALARQMKVATYMHRGFWHDLRTPLFYWRALTDLLTSPGAYAESGIEALRQLHGLKTQRQPGFLRDESSQIPSTVRVRGTVIVEPGCQVGDRSQLHDALLLPGAVVGPDEVIENAIIGAKLRVDLASAR